MSHVVFTVRSRVRGRRGFRWEPPSVRRSVLWVAATYGLQDVVGVGCLSVCLSACVREDFDHTQGRDERQYSVWGNLEGENFFSEAAGQPMDLSRRPLELY